MSKNITNVIKTVHYVTCKTTKNEPKNRAEMALIPIPKVPSRPSPRRHKRRQIHRADAHQATNAAAAQRPTIDQTADRFGADRELLGCRFDRQKRRKGSCAGCPKGGGIWGYLLSLRHGQALPPLIAPPPNAALPIAPKPAPVPPKPHEPHPPHQPKLRVGGGPLRQWGARVGSCEARYATPKNRAGVNPVTGLPTSSSLVAAWAGSNKSEGYGQPYLPRRSTGKPYTRARQRASRRSALCLVGDLWTKASRSPDS